MTRRLTKREPGHRAPVSVAATRGRRRWAVTKAVVFLIVLLALTGCATRREVGVSSGAATKREPLPDSWSAERSRWEQLIRVGITEEELLRIIRQDSWASMWMDKPPRTMQGAEMLRWAESRAVFVGRIHQDQAFRSAVAKSGPYYLYSHQGVPSTTSQMTVVCAVDGDGAWRVVYRAVRKRPCI